jgi:hypothetical protein
MEKRHLIVRLFQMLQQWERVRIAFDQCRFPGYFAMMDECQ